MTEWHPLLDAAVRGAVEDAASRRLGRRWISDGFTDLRGRASHPCGVFHGQPFSVFAKMSFDHDAVAQFRAELSGLAFLRQRAHVATPDPIGTGLISLERGALLVSVAVSERTSEARTGEDWRAVGHALARLHLVQDAHFGLALLNGFFGSFPQDNSPVTSNRWTDFYVERRLAPRLRSAVDSGHLPTRPAAEIERLMHRLACVGGPEPRPALLHGDAQQNNFMTTDTGALVVDAAPYFGHPELDLALLDYFHPVPDVVFDAYRDVAPISRGFASRRELWRMFAYLAVVTVDGEGPFGRRSLTLLDDAIRRYR